MKRSMPTLETPPSYKTTNGGNGGYQNKGRLDVNKDVVSKTVPNATATGKPSVLQRPARTKFR